MGETMLGDIFFILLISGLIYGLLSLKKSPPKGRLTGDLSASDDALREMFAGARNIAVVGIDDSQGGAAQTLDYLQQAGYHVFGIAPGLDSVLGCACYGSLEEVPERIDILDLFHLPESGGEIARSAVDRGVGVLWLEEGVVSPEAMEVASAGGLKVVMDRSLEKEHRRLAPSG